MKWVTINSKDDLPKENGYYTTDVRRMGFQDGEWIKRQGEIITKWLDESSDWISVGKPFCIAAVRDLINQYDKEEITLSRLVEILNETATGLDSFQLMNIPVAKPTKKVKHLPGGNVGN